MEHREAEALVRVGLEAMGTRAGEARGVLLDEDARRSAPASVSERSERPRPVAGCAKTMALLAPEGSFLRDGTTTWELLEVLVDGDRIAWAAERTARRADGSSERVEYVVLLRGVDGRIVEPRDTLDTLMAVQRA